MPPFADSRRHKRQRQSIGRGFNPNQARGPDGRWIETGAGHEAALKSVHSKQVVHAPFAEVSRPAETSRVAGVDVRGFKHTLSNQVVRHIMRRHPDVTARDLARLPKLVALTPSLAKKQGVNGVVRLAYRGRVDGIEYEYIAEVRKRAKRLDAYTFYRI